MFLCLGGKFSIGAAVLNHHSVWASIDTIAEIKGWSVSGLAKRAGLNATTFNRSKRTKGGRERWPSIETIAKILEVAEISEIDWIHIVLENPPPGGAALS